MKVNAVLILAAITPILLLVGCKDKASETGGKSPSPRSSNSSTSEETDNATLQLFLEAMWNRDEAKLAEAMKKGFPVNAVVLAHRSTPLHQAALSYAKHDGITRWQSTVLDTAVELIAKGADVNGRDGGGRTPLFEALRCPTPMASLLISKGADVNVVDKNGETPLFQAATALNKDAVALLLEAGAGESLTVGVKRGDSVLTPLAYLKSEKQRLEQKGTSGTTFGGRRPDAERLQKVTEIISILEKHGARE